MNAKKFLVGMAVAGGLAAGALGVSTGIANADTGLSHVAPVSVNWATDRHDHGGWNGDHGHGGGWNNGPGWNNGGGWNNGPGWNNGGYNGGPFPGGWNGGWEPNGGICLGPFCV